MFNRINRNKSKISIILALLLMLSPACQQHVYAFDEASADIVISSELEETEAAESEESVEEEAEGSENEAVAEDAEESEGSENEVVAEDAEESEGSEAETEAEEEVEAENAEVEAEEEAEAIVEETVEEATTAAENELSVEPETSAVKANDTLGGYVDDASGDALGGIVNNIYIPQSNANANISNSYEGTINDKYDITVRGVSSDVIKGVYSLIDTYIDRVMAEGIPLTINSTIAGQLIDAEKYSLRNKGYDQEHCWAATISNILWTTGYAQKAINPMTGQNFASEDELLTFCSENFTDNPGTPADGLDWLANDKYDLQNEPGVAHVKEGSHGGVLSDFSNNLSQGYINVAKKIEQGIAPNSALSGLNNLASYGMGVLVRWIMDDGTPSSGAHWMTVAGTVVDKTTDNITGILVANSDDNPADKKAPVDLNASWQDKLEAKQSQTNSYVMYRLSYSDQYKSWLLDGFSDRPTIITMLYYLLDSDKTPEGADDENNIDLKDIVNSPMSEMSEYINGNTNSINGTVSDNADSSSDNKDATGGVTVDVAINESDLISMVESYMTTNKLTILPSTNVISDNNADYEVYVLNSDVVSITINGKALTKDQYSIVTLKNGLKKIVIKNSFLKTLKNGDYKLSLKLDNGEVIETTFSINF